MTNVRGSALLVCRALLATAVVVCGLGASYLLDSLAAEPSPFNEPVGEQGTKLYDALMAFARQNRS
ncbi:MAG: hypothetical protein H6868_08250 [Rhodospirillales bacterium]|nr:hypothetical protein [Rhodospirillales bacterium]